MSSLTLAADLVRRHEGLRLDAYRDAGGRWTIGYGHAGAEVSTGLCWSAAKADENLQTDLAAAQAALKSVLRRALEPRQEAALLSLIFNIGAGAFAGSVLRAHVQAGNDLDAAKEFLRWDHVNQRESKGLLLRRLREAVLYLEGS